MRVLVLSDIHANLDALNAVLADAGGFDIIWSLGDIVGYGPEPNQCVARLSEYEHLAIVGNHDWAALAKLDLGVFTSDARQSILWTREQLTPKSRAYLEALPKNIVQGDFTLAHGSPRHPIWEYLISASAAKANFSYYETSICLVGHTHVPALFRHLPDSGQCQVLRLPARMPIGLDDKCYIINPGAVGQPRDGDPRAAYLLLDTESRTIECRRVGYDVAEAQRKMRAIDLPARNSVRLVFGW